MRIAIITLLVLCSLAAPAQNQSSLWQDYQIARKQAHKNWIQRHPYWSLAIAAGAGVTIGTIVHHEIGDEQPKPQFFLAPRPSPRPIPAPGR